MNLVTTIKETKVIIITLSLDHLLGSLITHEMTIGEDQAKKKRKGIAFKDSGNNEEELNDKEMVLVTRKLKCFFNRNVNGRRGESCAKIGTY